MSSPKVLILTGYAINSEEETAFAFEQQGATPDIVHVNDLIDRRKKLSDYQIFVAPGGFAHGDHTGAGKAMANKLFNNLRDEILAFVRRDTLTLGICNGFQMITALGLVPALQEKYGERQAALMANENARVTCTWVHMKNISQKCVFTKGIEFAYYGIAHGEGKYYMEESELQKLKENDQIVFQYVEENGSPANGKYPANPNGALMDIAAVCDPTGRILGIMPHPERSLFLTNRPDFTVLKEQYLREGKSLPAEGDGQKIFENAVKYFA
ncbi:phosphoribosylformylglycinamidine synthase subunit PurQ [Candidatus Peregrinibacteria bacterium]|nr:phosphoribosylformylglycinamidine synthase subunit PurQ [Candidatus Peregrinibacteria bacterium]